MVELLPIAFIGPLGAHHKTAFGHRVLPLICLGAIIASREAPGRHAPHPASPHTSISLIFRRISAGMPPDAHISQDATNCLCTAIVVLQSAKDLLVVT